MFLVCEVGVQLVGVAAAGEIGLLSQVESAGGNLLQSRACGARPEPAAT